MIDDPCSLLKNVAALAAEAGSRIMKVYAGAFNVEHKDDHSPLTEADLAAHETIIAGLKKLAPDIPVLSEEDVAAVPFAERSKWEWLWLVDPLDGTREFIKRNGEFTVNIALVHRYRAVLGVIHVPVTGVTYTACKGKGAFRTEPNGDSRQIKVRSWNGGRITIAGSRSHGGAEFDQFLQHFKEYDLVNMGSSLKACLVAEGKADIYARFGPTSEWDTAAAQCIVEEAGGHFTQVDLQPLQYNTKESLLNPWFLVFGDARPDWAAMVPPQS